MNFDLQIILVVHQFEISYMKALHLNFRGISCLGFSKKGDVHTFYISDAGKPPVSEVFQPMVVGLVEHLTFRIKLAF